MAEIHNNQEEHEHIETALEVEEIDTNLYHSKSLWLPLKSKGVYGGQVISQGLVSATKSVDSVFSLHSLHCYFLLSASPAIPIIYHVGRVRDGRSYATRSVSATQRGRTIFVMLCSFQRPEPRQPNHQWPMPEVPSPEECEDVEAYWERLLAQPEGVHPSLREYATAYIKERKHSPMATKTAGITGSSDGATVYMWWFKAKNIPKYDAPFQKCILSYISDSQFIATVSRTLGISYNSPRQLAMQTSLDHTIWFYNDDFDCGDWLLYVVESPRAGNGRGVVHGRLYTRSGTLVAVTSQEGVVRATEPVDESMSLKAKL